MKATLEFTLPDDVVEFNNASRATEVLSVVEDVLHYIRGRLKHGTVDGAAAAELEEIRTRLLEAVSY